MVVPAAFNASAPACLVAALGVRAQKHVQLLVGITVFIAVSLRTHAITSGRLADDSFCQGGMTGKW